ncbi:MAG: hypothetical protein O3C43_16440 [Verrucomicrobia bacterium]|nr:hypothetical protein [Verrucomicrobiota bacterium]
MLTIILFGCSQENSSPFVILTDGIDETAGNVPCYIITTPIATYYLEKEGGGLSSMLDVEGVDWIGFHKDLGTESKGEYRGFPNAIHKQDGSYFHARNAGTDPSTSTITIQEPNRIQIVFTSENGQWEGVWDFSPTHCDFTMNRVSPGRQYWILYEGVPGGKLDKTDFWYSSKDEVAHSIDEKQNDDLPGPEWIAFGDVTSPRMIVLVNHLDDVFPDRYYNMRDEMTVFGFGRAGGEKYLDSPLSFTICFVESTDYPVVKDSVFTQLNR